MFSVVLASRSVVSDGFSSLFALRPFIPFKSNYLLGHVGEPNACCKGSRGPVGHNPYKVPVMKTQ